jgi:two-component system sensor histidine kinase ChvG
MASATDSERNDEGDLALSWSGRWTLGHRIFAVNVLTLLIFALSILYLDSYRDRLMVERRDRIAGETQIAAEALEAAPPRSRPTMLDDIGQANQSRLRVFGKDGAKIGDSWATGEPTYQLRDPKAEKWKKSVARALDRGFNAIVGADTPPDFAEPRVDDQAAWPLLATAGERPTVEVRNAPDLTPVFVTGVRLADGSTLLVTKNDRNLTRTVRSQRGTLGLALAVATILSVLLSLFLARTIVQPLRRIASAAHRVRLGRAREVRVPRLPSRRDEIGLLARSVSDMSQSLRMRIDNIEAFAADVTHELKNPLASLRSAVDSLEKVDDPKLRAQLLDVVRQDVRRLDRLIGDVGEAARTDAELARASFERTDLGPLIQQLVQGWERRRETGNVRIAFARPRKETATVMAEPTRLARAIDNIIDNAISFSPPGGLVAIAAIHVDDKILIRVDDEGPGVPDELKDAIFNRFHSVRPGSEPFGRHSGLGLAIAKAIVDGHDGAIDVSDRDDAPSGARFTIILPAADLT